MAARAATAFLLVSVAAMRSLLQLLGYNCSLLSLCIAAAVASRRAAVTMAARGATAAC